MPVNSNLTYAVNCVRTGLLMTAQVTYGATVTLVGYYTYQWGCKVRLDTLGRGGYPSVGANSGTPLMSKVIIRECANISERMLR